jgi:hypothetical protein
VAPSKEGALAVIELLRHLQRLAGRPAESRAAEFLQRRQIVQLGRGGTGSTRKGRQPGVSHLRLATIYRRQHLVRTPCAEKSIPPVMRFLRRIVDPQPGEAG